MNPRGTMAKRKQRPGFMPFLVKFQCPLSLRGGIRQQVNPKPTWLSARRVFSTPFDSDKMGNNVCVYFVRRYVLLNNKTTCISEVFCKVIFVFEFIFFRPNFIIEWNTRLVSWDMKSFLWSTRSLAAVLLTFSVLQVNRHFVVLFVIFSVRTWPVSWQLTGEAAKYALQESVRTKDELWHRVLIFRYSFPKTLFLRREKEIR